MNGFLGFEACPCCKGTGIKTEAWFSTNAETEEMRLKATEADALTMALRLLGEDNNTFSPDVAEVMDRWRPLALAALDHAAKHGIDA